MDLHYYIENENSRNENGVEVKMEKRRIEKERLKRLKVVLLDGISRYIKNRVREIIDPGKLSDYIEGLRKKHSKFKGKLGDEWNHCMSSSWITSECLKAYGFNAEVKTIAVFVANEKARKILDGLISDKNIENHGPGFMEKYSEELDRVEGAYTLGVGWSDDENDYHSVVKIDNSFLDLTAIQFSRPERNIVVDNYWKKIDRLPEEIVWWKYIDREIHGGALINHPNILKLFNHILMEIGLAIGVKPKTYGDIKVKIRRIESEVAYR